MTRSCSSRSFLIHCNFTKTTKHDKLDNIDRGPNCNDSSTGEETRDFVTNGSRDLTHWTDFGIETNSVTSHRPNSGVCSNGEEKACFVLSSRRRWPNPVSSISDVSYFSSRTCKSVPQGWETYHQGCSVSSIHTLLESCIPLCAGLIL